MHVSLLLLIFSPLQSFARIQSIFDNDIQELQEQSMDSFEDAVDSINDNVASGIFGLFPVQSVFVISLIMFSLALSLSGLVFNIFMIIDCYKRDFDDRTLWLVLLIAGLLMNFGLIVSTIYYFLVKKENKGVVKK